MSKKSNALYAGLFSERLNFLMNDEDIRVGELASAIKATPSQICKWKTGEHLPDIFRLDDLATYFNVSIDYLIGRVDELDWVIIR